MLLPRFHCFIKITTRIDRIIIGWYSNSSLLALKKNKLPYLLWWVFYRQDSHRCPLLVVSYLVQAAATWQACPCTAPWVGTQSGRTWHDPSEHPQQTDPKCNIHPGGRLLVLLQTHASPMNHIFKMNSRRCIFTGIMNIWTHFGYECKWNMNTE